MPTLSQRTAAPLIKLLYIGNSGSGKTGSLVSLAEAGYELRICDLDNGLDSLAAFAESSSAELLDRIQYRGFRDRTKMASNGPKIDGKPRALPELMKALERWPEDDTDPAEWGPDKILVIDSLTQLGTSCFSFAKSIDPTARDERQIYRASQRLLESVIANLTDESFATNVIVISHIDVIEQKDGTIKGFPSTIGSALGPKIGRYFNTMLLAETSGSGKAVKRTIKTLPTSLLDLKNPAPMKVEPTYDLSTGMAQIFRALGGHR